MVVSCVALVRRGALEKNVQVLHWNGTSLTDRGERIRVNGGSAALRIADTP